MVVAAICESSLVIASTGQWRRKQSQNPKIRMEEEVLEVRREKRRHRLRRGGNLELPGLCFCLK